MLQAQGRVLSWEAELASSAFESLLFLAVSLVFTPFPYADRLVPPKRPAC